MKNLRKLIPTERVDAEAYNRLVDYVKSIELKSANRGIAIKHTASGIHLELENKVYNVVAKDIPTPPGTNPPTTTSETIFLGIVTQAIQYTPPAWTSSASGEVAIWGYTVRKVKRNKALTGSTKWLLYSDIDHTLQMPSPTNYWDYADTTNYTAYNLCELMNPREWYVIDDTTTAPTTTIYVGSGLHGNGVDTSGVLGSTSMTIQPIPTGVILPVYITTNTGITGDAGVVENEYWVYYQNGIDGEC